MPSQETIRGPLHDENLVSNVRGRSAYQKSKGEDVLHSLKEGTEIRHEFLKASWLDLALH
jgi:hypothetical protein